MTSGPAPPRAAPRPPIGVTIGSPRGRDGFLELRRDYVRSVETAGGQPLLLAPGRAEDARAALSHVRGLLLSGGGDVDPNLYGEPAHPRTRIARERDDFELALAREALDRGLPILAICRGQQVLNVARGGTLVQDIPSVVAGGVDHDPQAERWEAAHEVEILPGTRLREILGRDVMAVNSFHHQAVSRPGSGLLVSARAVGDGVIEGIEAEDQAFCIGVQWHPEGFWGRADGFQRLFDALVAASA